MVRGNGVVGVAEAAKAKHAEQGVQTERVTMSVGRNRARKRRQGWCAQLNGRQLRAVLETKKREVLCLPLRFSLIVLGFLCPLLPLWEKGWG